MKNRIIRCLLQKELGKRKSQNPRSSLRSLAKKLEIPVSTLCDIKNGKRNLSSALFIDLVSKLGIEQRQKDLLVILTEKDLDFLIPFHPEFQFLREDIEDCLDYQLMAILALMFEANETSLASMAKMMGLSLDKVKNVKQELVEQRVIHEI